MQRAILFWRGAPRPQAAEESLAALLTRREQVLRSRQAVAPVEPKADLFRPEKPITEPLAEATGATDAPPTIQPPTEPKKPSDQSPKPAGETSTTSRLLEAKRRAQKRKE